MHNTPTTKKEKRKKEKALLLLPNKGSWALTTPAHHLRLPVQ
jgi:hypothetical protein